MLCPACGSDNPATARFCNACGAGLEGDCPSCGHTNPSGSRFCNACGGPLASLAASPSNRPTPEPSRAAAHPEPESFADGRYRVRHFLGEGGKKKVFLAHDTLLDRDVAFALIKTEGLDAAARERFIREAQAMGRLGTHPHIVTVFDLGEHPSLASGQASECYMVTELMAGGDVEGVIAQAPDHKLPLDQAIGIADQVCRGLEFAHSKGIVHRDLKPGNVWLTGDPSTGSPSTPIHRGSESARRTEQAIAKIGDFGLAVAVDRTRLTQAGMMVGTVSYMPPEQATGGEITPRSDLYSLGAMLYEMVCGRPPFLGDEPVAIIGQHLNTPPVAPTWHRPECPQGLEALILRLLEKDANKRPASATEVRQALAGIALTPPLSQGEREQAQPPTPGADPLYRRVFVGREHELRQVNAAFDAALSGQGSLVMVVGEPGIGKTSLCEQLATYTALRGGKALVGHCYEEGSLSLPYLPFVEALRGYVLQREPEGLKEDLGSGAADVARIISEVRDRVHVELRPSGDPEDDRWRLYQAVTGFLRNASSVQPLTIVLEDLHDADRGTLDLLVHVARNLQGARLLLVGTYRDVEVDRAHPLSGILAELRRGSQFQRVPLRGLTVEEVHRMMTIVRGQEPPWGRAEAIHRQTEGNPLFIQEVLRYLVEEGIVVREGGRYIRTDAGEADAGIPEGLRDVIGKRLSRLSEQTNQVLSIAAVVGRDFRLDALQRVANLPEAEVEEALEEATERAVIEQRQALGTMGFRFTHAFFRQTLYEEIFVPRRIRWHQQVAHALEQIYGRRVEEHAAELAEHYAQSTERQDLTKALHYSEAAARRAMAVYAYGEAVRHLEQALKVQEVLDPDDEAKRCDLLLELADALMPAGEPLRASEEMEVAYALAESVEDPEKASQCCRVALDALFRYGGGAASVKGQWGVWAQRADRHAQPRTLSRVYADLALAELPRTRSGSERRARLVAGLDLARSLGEPQTLFECAGSLLRGAGEPESPAAWAEGLTLAQEFGARPRDGVRVTTLAGVLSNSGSFLLAWGDRSSAEELWREVTELAQRTRDTYVALRPPTFEIMLRTLDGDLEGALEAADRVAALGAQGGSPLYAQTNNAWHGMRARLYLGRARAALESLDTLNTIEPSSRLPGGAVLTALVLAHLGRHGEAAGLLREGLLVEGNTVLKLLEAAVLLKDRAATAALMERFKGLGHLLNTRGRELTCFARHLGAGAALLGELDQAKAYYHQAIEVCARVRFRPELALSRLQLAELLLEHYPEEKAEALEHLDSAIAEFRDMKMQPSLEQALKHKELLTA